MTCKLYPGIVYHARHKPFFHEFRYRIFSLWFEIGVKPHSRLLSFNRFNLFSFYDRDHGPRDGTDVGEWLRAAALEKKINLEGGRIFFLGFPRILGYLFNPLSLFFCYTADGNLSAIAYQVKNTFGDLHVYLIPVKNYMAGQTISQKCSKIFHVSPFLPMDCDYHFRLKVPDDDFFIAIHQFQQGDKILTATWNGQAEKFSDWTLLRYFFLYPLMTLKIIAAIHWQALKIWLKGGRYHRRPPPPEKILSSETD